MDAGGEARMLFGKRKAERELLCGQFTEQLQALTEEVREGREALAELGREVKQNGTDISRHDMALEDCLDMLEEWKEDRDQERKRRQELEQEREKLLTLFQTYQEQLWDMKTYAREKDAVWYQQLLLLEKAVQESMLMSGLTEINQTGCAVNYELHEVIEVRDTEDVHRDRTVAAIYRPGCLYQGKVRKKARVAAFRLQKA